jgi:ATP-dependent RNA helicase SUPV3L1/SUV3
MMSVLGCGDEDMALILKALGFREQRTTNEAGVETVQWLQRSRREERRPRPQKPEAAPRRNDGERKPEGDARADGGRRGQQGPRRDRTADGRDERPRGDFKKGEFKKGGHKKDDHKAHGKPPARKPEKPFVVDPDSPFAALSALKFKK